MLANFKVRNFRNFRDDIDLNFQNIKNYEFNEDAISNGIIKDAIFYGPNAAGKTSLGYALLDITLHMCDKNKQLDDYAHYTNLNSLDKTAHFEYTFQFEKGRLSVLPESKASSLPTLYDRNDEMEAYTVQNICVSGINYFRCPDKRDTYTTITNENNEEIEHNYRWGTETISKLAGNLNDLPRKNKRLRGPNDPVIETLNKNGEIYNRYLK